MEPLRWEKREPTGCAYLRLGDGVIFDVESLLVWEGIRADEVRVLERETARELFGEWKEGRRRSRRGL